MKKNIKTILVTALCAVYASCAENEQITVNQASMKWWYNKPATKFWEGIPIGTGRFVAMMPGNVDHEIIPFNDETLWTGGPYNPARRDAQEALAKVREYTFARNWQAANEEAKKLFGDPVHVQFYQPMAQLNIAYAGHQTDKVGDYRRELDMDKGLVNVSYTLDGVKYSRQTFASFPEQVIVYHITADSKEKINLSVWLTSLQPTAKARIDGDAVVMEGSTISEKPHEIILPPQMRWQARVQTQIKGGKRTIDGDKINISNADEVVLVLAGATNWVNWNDVSANEKKRCEDYIGNAVQYSCKELLKRHLDDYCPIFNACRLDLGADPNPLQTTTQAMEAIRKGAIDPAYEARYFQYSRYLMLCGAREGTLAFNNHNPWLNDMDGRWRGRWTLNINIQECYWPVENTNMPIINESLLLFVENLAQSGARTAKEMFGCGGWCACHGTDVWFHSAPTDIYPHYGLWTLSGVWLMQQLYDHYEYNPDTEYLKRIYPLMKGAAEFCIDFLVEDPETGLMVTSPSTSPENSFFDETGRYVAVSFAAAADIQLIKHLFRNCIAAGKTLNADAEMRTQMEQLINRMPTHKIGKHGQLQEWFYDFDEPEPTHRHVMHLYAMYPDDDIALRRTPELAEAVRTVLKRRGTVNNSGWSGAWKISLHARLEEPDAAYTILHKMLADVSLHPNEEDSQISPSFEGNQAIQGVAAGVAEMLMQSHSGEISLLPALPQQWAKGAVKGFRARGGYELDFSWDKSKLTKAVIKSKYDKTCRLRTKTPIKVFLEGKEIPVKTIENELIEFETKSEKKYCVF
ncbi:MAG: glycoside hydrolase N-terminal domain-containing protein [Prevotellaceae bacterium]|jgi:alpha-L-fucosidase 2|nr:glycoside hydrolase N-terminal domain-containing protein [Prevotellaceae bacterium]